jgi:hypothetical protein
MKIQKIEELVPGTKYNIEDREYNPYYYIGVDVDGELVFQDNRRGIELFTFEDEVFETIEKPKPSEIELHNKLMSGWWIRFKGMPAYFTCQAYDPEGKTYDFGFQFFELRELKSKYDDITETPEI